MAQPIVPMSLENKEAWELGMKTTSFLVIVAGFLLLVGVGILGAFIAGSRISRDEEHGKDAFMISVTVSQIVADFNLTYMPRKFWPKKTTPSGKSPLFSVVWTFLFLWIAMTGVYLILAGSLTAIEVFHEKDHLIAAGLVSLALVFCGLWMITFRIGSKTPHEKKMKEEEIRRLRADQIKAHDGKEIDVNQAIRNIDSAKKDWFWVSFVVLSIAYVLVVTAAAMLQPWLLPGEQYGQLLFLGPGYGLLGGWLGFAASLNYGIAVCSASCPDGVAPPPTDEDSRAYNGSLIPVVLAIIQLCVASFLPDPAHAVPALVALLFFTPKYNANLGAAALLGIGIGVGTWQVLSQRG